MSDTQVIPNGKARNRQTTKTPDVSVVMPCLNEAASVAGCVAQARETFKHNGINGEVVVCDNGSTDDSAELAMKAGARVVFEGRRGYGSAYLRALSEAKGRYIVMADADGTYDFTLIPQFITPLQDGYDMVMGSRMRGEMAGGAMPWTHRYVGVPVLTGFLNVVAGGSVSDAHCGMRSLTRKSVQELNLSTEGMEFASEMIVKAIRARMKIAEVPIPYHARVGESKLRTVRDGWRHLRFLLLESPFFLFLIPGLLMIILGLAALAVLTPGPLQFGSVTFDFHYMVVGALLAILGWQVLTLGLFAKVFSVTSGLYRPDRPTASFMRLFSLEKALAGSSTVAVAGFGLLFWVLLSWVEQGLGFRDGIMLRPALLGMTLVVLGLGSAFSSFFLSALMLRRQPSSSMLSARN